MINIIKNSLLVKICYQKANFPKDNSRDMLTNTQMTEEKKEFFISFS